MLGARAALRSRPQPVPPGERPAIFDAVPGQVLRVAEPVFETRSVLRALARPHLERLVRVKGPEGIELSSRSGEIDTVTLRGESGEILLRPRSVVLAAGTGNEGILSRLGLDAGIAQRRPLHMTLLRSPDLPLLHGHCVDGNRTRVTVTSGHDDRGSVVWQLGGELAENGVGRSAEDLMRHASREIQQALPALDLTAMRDVEWATYRVDRAELKTRRWARPDGAFVNGSDDIITVWPTKMVLAPNAAEKVDALIEQTSAGNGTSAVPFIEQPTPHVASPPWETARWS